MLDLCIPCKEKGKFRAVYKIVKGVPMCGGCVSDQQESAQAPEAMGKAETASRNKNVSGAADSGESRNGGTRAVSLSEPEHKKGKGKMAKRIDDATKQQVLKDHADGMNNQRDRHEARIGMDHREDHHRRQQQRQEASFSSIASKTCDEEWSIAIHGYDRKAA
jgi:hypothetical protein